MYTDTHTQTHTPTHIYMYIYMHLYIYMQPPGFFIEQEIDEHGSPHIKSKSVLVTSLGRGGAGGQGEVTGGYTGGVGGGRLEGGGGLQPLHGAAVLGFEGEVFLVDGVRVDALGREIDALGREIDASGRRDRGQSAGMPARVGLFCMYWVFSFVCARSPFHTNADLQI
jgi:hypothetical protein